MVLLKIASFNLLHNKFQSATIIVLLTASLTVLIGYRGYIRYVEQGQRMGYISRSADLQIAHESFRDDTSEEKKSLPKPKSKRSNIS